MSNITIARNRDELKKTALFCFGSAVTIPFLKIRVEVSSIFSFTPSLTDLLLLEGLDLRFGDGQVLLLVPIVSAHSSSNTSSFGVDCVFAIK